MRIRTKRIACIVLSAAMVVTNGNIPAVASASTLGGIADTSVISYTDGLDEDVALEDDVAIADDVADTVTGDDVATTEDDMATTEDPGVGEDVPAAPGHKVNVPGFTVTGDSNSLVIVEYTGSDTEVDMNQLFAGINVVRIADHAFFKNKTLNKVTLPASMSSIGTAAFYECSSLTEVTLPENSNLSVIEKQAFYRCTSLVTFDGLSTSKLTTIGEEAFRGCSSLGSKEENPLTFPETLVSIGDEAFLGCNKLAKVIFVNDCPKMESIGESAFQSTHLKEVVIPDGVNSLGSGAFCICEQLQRAVLPKSCKNVPDQMFDGCSSLTDVTIPEGYTTIGASAFERCALSDVTLPASCISVGAGAFDDNPNIGVVCFLNENTSIATDTPYWAFPYGASNLVLCTKYSGKASNRVMEYARKKKFRFAYIADDLTIANMDEVKQQYLYGEELETDDIHLEATVTFGEESSDISVESADCIFSGFNPKSAASQTVTIRYGVQTVTLPVNVYYDLSEAHLKDYNIEYQTYTGSAIEPDFTMIGYETDRAISKDKYTIDWGENHTDVGTVTATLTGTAPATGSGLYIGKTTISFEIVPKNVEDKDIKVTVPDMEYTGQKVTPVPVVSYGAIALQEGRDYTVSYDSYWNDNIEAGKGVLFIEGKGNYEGIKEVEFTILPKDISAAEISDIPDQIYTGQAVTPSITAKLDRYTSLVEGVDYTVKYVDNIQAGTGSALIVGKGNYTGSVEKKFVIRSISILEASIEDILAQIYSGQPIIPNVNITYDGHKMVEGTDYTLSGQNNIDVGEATLTIIGKGSLEGSITKKFTINKRSIADALIADIAAVEYTGTKVEPQVKVTVNNVVLEQDKDYTVEYEDNVLPGTATVIVTGKGNYCDTAEKKFEITGISIDDAEVTAPTSLVYNGKEQTPAITVTLDGKELVEGEDYSVAYTNNKNVGVATVTVTGEGQYAGTVEKTFSIVAKELDESGFTAKDSVEYTTGKLDLEDKMVVDGTTLTKGVDYTVTFEDDVKLGKATALVEGIGNYTGKFEYEFEITAKDISKIAEISGVEEKVTYTGEEITPEVTVTVGDVVLKADEDYTVTYADNKEAGTATVTVTGKGNYTGSVVVTFEIEEAAPEETPMPEETPNPGNNNTPAPGNNNTPAPGNSTTPDGNTDTSQGTSTQKLTITAKDVTLDTEVVYNGKTPDIDIEVEVDGEILEEKTDYTVAYSNMKKPGIGTVTITGVGSYQGVVKKNVTILPTKAKLSSVKAKKNNKAVAKWKKVAEVTGYEISIATNKKFTANKQVKNAKGTSYTFKNLKKKKYFVRVRAYVSVNGKKVYGAYSTVTTLNMSKN